MSYLFLAPPAAIAAAYVLDLVIGDPERLPHPVRWIGGLIRSLETALRRPGQSPALERFLGAVLAVTVAGLTFGTSFSLLYFSRKYSTALYYAVSVYIVWTCLSIKCLKTEARMVLKALQDSGLEGARSRLSRIVGRDTKSLSREGVLKAVVETVSENTSDGIIAPLFYLAIGGPALMMAYKAVNTLDSMVGYKSEKYIDFGRSSARLDDAANYIPARLTSLLIICTSFILGYNWMRSFKVLRRDGRNHPSPNSGLPEAAVAGALGLRLGGPMRYGGVLHDKPYIGDNASQAGPEAVVSTIRIMEISALLMVGITLAVRLLVTG